MRHLLLVVLLAFPEVATAQDATWDVKDPDLARRYASYFPGAGHFYTGETLKGGVMAGVALFSGVKLLKVMGCSAAERTIFDEIEGCNKSEVFLWLAGIAGPWIYGVTDARKSAERANARRGFSAFISPGVEGSLRLGLSLSFGGLR